MLTVGMHEIGVSPSSSVEGFHLEQREQSC
jgi:hypothetical protein